MDIKAKDLNAPPERPILKIEPLEEDRIYVLDQDNAQALIRIEFPAGLYDPDNHVPMELYRNYFGGGMSSVVFQQLREARSLAYSAWAWYFPPAYPNEQNIVAGFIGTQADKTPEALKAFLDLFENLPIAESSFEEIRGNLESEMRTEPIPYSAIPATVQAWSQKGIKKDPRPAQFEEIEAATTKALSDFHTAKIKQTPKRLSLVGNSEEIKLETFDTIQSDDVFTQ